MRKTLMIVLFAALAILLSSCINSAKPEDEGNDDFNYGTTKEIDVLIETYIPNVFLEIFRLPEGIDEDPDERIVIFEGTADGSGRLSISLTVPSYVDRLYVKRNYIGQLSDVLVMLKDDRLFLDYNNPDVVESKAFEFTLSSLYVMPYQTLGGWNASGVPDYLDGRDKISKELLETINNALPERLPVPIYNPHYIADSAQTNIEIVEEADVFVTFVHEGAGYRNSLGFYTYETAAGAPESIDPSEITLIFPNVSYKGSGGGLTSGDRVSIGRFKPGTTIGWVIITNGYDSKTYLVGDGYNKFYSNEEYNPEPDPSHKAHVVLLNYEDEGKLILSFEDLRRPDGDNDFNDAVFYVASNPVTAISTQNVVKTTDEPPLDSDGDGIPDSIDPAPYDKTIVSSTAFPGKDKFASLIFEDLWPYKGDYDFNDLIVDYNFVEFMNDKNEIVKIEGRFKVRAILAGMSNGFGFELGIPFSYVSKVSGAQYSYPVNNTTEDRSIFLEENGTEQRQEKAVIIVFDRADEHLDPSDNKEVVVSIDLKTPVTRQSLGSAPYNPFVISNGERGREVHLPGFAPTDLVWLPYFGSKDDATILGTAFTYKSIDNLPWGLNMPDSFDYPKDGVEIQKIYKYFDIWANSGGKEYKDWYLNKEGYRENTHLLF